MTKHITLVVTGSVAAIKTFQLAEQLQNARYEIDFVVTQAVWKHKLFESSKYNPSKDQLEYLKRIAIDEHDTEKLHATIARSEKILVCPASANFISQIANETSALGKLLRYTNKPLFIAPAMNVMMWQHPAVAGNVDSLKHANFLGPALGHMACGDMGYGRLAELSDIVKGLENSTQSLFKKAKIWNSILPQEMSGEIKNILLIAHHNQDNQAITYAQSLVDDGFNVQCMIATEIKDVAKILQSITRNPPIWEHYQKDPQGMEHIRLPEQSDVVVIAPTSEPYLTEMAHGASASLCGCTYLATKKPVIIVAKDSAHINTLKTHGATVVSSAQELNAYLKKKTMKQDLTSKKILILAGNPSERVDTFRFYVNDTISCQLAIDEAKRLQSNGADITVVSPAASKLKIVGIKVVDTFPDGRKVESARDMLTVSEQIASTEEFNVVLQLAGISSITCKKPSSSKIQKTGPSKAQLFEVVGNVDIKKELEKIFPSISIAGYDQYQEWFGNQNNKPAFASPQLAAEPTKKSEQVVLERKEKKLLGKRIVVTTGRTEEILTATGDKITNFFSGMQGQVIAKACAEMGANVILISGPTHLADVDNANVRTVHVVSAKEMYEATMQALEQPSDVLIGVAAVADFCAEHLVYARLKEGELHTLSLQENPSIVGDVAKHTTKRPHVVVSFAAQSPETIQEYAEAKFHKLGVDLTVANPIGNSTRPLRKLAYNEKMQGAYGVENRSVCSIHEDSSTGVTQQLPLEAEFTKRSTIASRDPSKNQVMLIDRNGTRQFPEMSKDEVATIIANEVASFLLKLKHIAKSIS